MLPTVSVLIPSLPARAHMLARALLAARTQTYPDVEVLVDDGPGRIGEKRNRLVRAASGKILVHFDDDDMHSPHRVGRQVAALLANPSMVACGSSSLYVWNDAERYAVEVEYAQVVPACTLAYWRSAWEEHPFDERTLTAECATFKLPHKARTLDMHDRELMIYVRHGGNVTGTAMPLGVNRQRATDAVRALGWPMV